MRALPKPEQAWGAALGTPRRAPPPPAVLRPGFPRARTHASRPQPSYAFFLAVDRPLLWLATPWTRCSEHPRACAPACPRPSPSAKPWHAQAWLCPDHQTVVPHWYTRTRRNPRMRTPCQPEGRALWIMPRRRLDLVLNPPPLRRRLTAVPPRGRTTPPPCLASPWLRRTARARTRTAPSLLPCHVLVVALPPTSTAVAFATCASPACCPAQRQAKPPMESRRRRATTPRKKSPPEIFARPRRRRRGKAAVAQ